MKFSCCSVSMGRFFLADFQDFPGWAFLQPTSLSLVDKRRVAAAHVQDLRREKLWNSEWTRLKTVAPHLPKRSKNSSRCLQGALNQSTRRLATQTLGHCCPVALLLNNCFRFWPELSCSHHSSGCSFIQPSFLAQLPLSFLSFCSDIPGSHGAPPFVHVHVYKRLQPNAKNPAAGHSNAEKIPPGLQL